MKNIIKTIIIGATALGFASCSDFLDQTSPSDLSKENVYSSAYYTRNALNKVYGLLVEDATYSQVLAFSFMVNSDCELVNALGESKATEDAKGHSLNNYYTSKAGTFDKVQRAWDKMYEAIEDCNDLIANVSDKSSKELLYYKGEALTLRAMLYFDLVRNWGDVPLKMDPTREDLSNINHGKTDRDVIMDTLIVDLTKAIDLLPWADQSGYTTEHVTKGYAHALLAQITMQRAGWAIREQAKTGYETASKNSDPVYPTQRPSADVRTKYYRLALEHLNAVIGSGVHALNPSFANEWYLINQRRLDTQYRENIFEIPMGLGSSGELGYSVGVRVSGATAKFGPKGNSSANVQLTAPLFWSFDQSGKDTRRDVTCATYTISTDAGTGLMTEKMDGNKPFAIYCAKWDFRKMNEEWRQLAVNSDASSKVMTGINTVKLRYSQVLLLYAEVLNELNGGPDNSTGGAGMTAREALAAVHGRAYASADKSVAENYVNGISADKDAFFNALVDENAWEFAGEGVRKYELERWNLLSDKIDQMKADYTAQLNQYPAKLYYKTYQDADGVKIDMSSVCWYEEPANTDGYTSVTFWGAELTDSKQQNLKSFLPYISGGLNATVKNRYLLPIYSTTISDAAGTLQNSYGFDNK